MMIKTQNDKVKDMLMNNYKPQVTKLRLPGITSLHTKTPEEIAIVFTNVFRSQPNIKEVKWVVGEYIELISDDPQA